MTLSRRRPEPGKPRQVHIHIGEHHVSDDPNVTILTVLGSCISACIRDPRLRIGGMNHFMLPGQDSAPSATSNAMRYGHAAMERLINDLLAAGAKRGRLEVKLFGGASTFQNGLRIGDRNIAFAREYLAAERMPIAAADLGGTSGRRLRYTPTTGEAMRLLIHPERDGGLFDRELAFGTSLSGRDVEGSVELFE